MRGPSLLAQRASNSFSDTTSSRHAGLTQESRCSSAAVKQPSLYEVRGLRCFSATLQSWPPAYQSCGHKQSLSMCRETIAPGAVHSCPPARRPAEEVRRGRPRRPLATARPRSMALAAAQAFRPCTQAVCQRIHLGSTLTCNSPCLVRISMRSTRRSSTATASSTQHGAPKPLATQGVSRRSQASCNHRRSRHIQHMGRVQHQGH